VEMDTRLRWYDGGIASRLARTVQPDLQ